MPALGLFLCFASLLCQHCLMLLGGEGKGQFFYWWDVAVGSLRLGYIKVRSMKEGKILTSNQCTSSSNRDECAQNEEISTATPLASLVHWKRQIGNGNIWKHCPLQSPSTLLTHLRAMCLRACCERWCHTLTSPTSLCISSSILHVSGAVPRNYLPMIDIIHRQRICVRIIWPQTINAMIIFCSGFEQAPVSEESWFRTEASR